MSEQPEHICKRAPPSCLCYGFVDYANDDCCIHGGGLEIPRCECGRFVKWELLKTDFSQLADLIDNSKRIVFLTGAGVSVASGLPTYTNDDGERDPATFDSSSPEYRVITEELEGLIKGASPCNAHKLPKVLLDAGKDTYVITQNVDGLYQRAGFPESNLIEMHGNYDRGNIVAFDNRVDLRLFKLAQGLVEGADLVIIMGTGLWVYPFASLGDINPVVAVVNKGDISCEEDPFFRPVVRSREDCELLSSWLIDIFSR